MKIFIDENLMWFLDIKIQVVDAINHYKNIRDMFTLTLDSIMEKLHIAEDGNCNKNL